MKRWNIALTVFVLLVVSVTVASADWAEPKVPLLGMRGFYRMHKVGIAASLMDRGLPTCGAAVQAAMTTSPLLQKVAMIEGKMMAKSVTPPRPGTLPEMKTKSVSCLGMCASWCAQIPPHIGVDCEGWIQDCLYDCCDNLCLQWYSPPAPAYWYCYDFCIRGGI